MSVSHQHEDFRCKQTNFIQIKVSNPPFGIPGLSDAS